VPTEIEAKIKLKSIEQAEGKLKSLCAEFIGLHRHLDIFFDTADNRLYSFGAGLRLRKLTCDDSEKYILTYKGPKQKGKYKKRQEVEIEVSNFDAAGEMLAAIGFEKKLTYEKQRYLWRFKQCKVCLDSVPLLGEFIEVEGPGEGAIAGVLQSLGLNDCEHINTSYSKLIHEKLAELGIETKEVYFDLKIR